MTTSKRPPSPNGEWSDDKNSWGIIRYAAGSGVFPEDDAAGFDGWYTSRADALAVAEDWVKRHPQWIVALVRSDLVRFGNGDFRTVRHRALTKRERSFLERHCYDDESMHSHEGGQ